MRPSVVIFAVSLISAPIFAQTPTTVDELSQRARAALQDPSLSSPITAALSQLTLISSGDETSLRAEAGTQAGEWGLGLRIETAIESGTAKADLIDIAGLTGKSKATFTATRTFAGDFDETAILDVCDDYNEAVGQLDPLPPGPSGCGDRIRQNVADWDRLASGRVLSPREQAGAERDRALLAEFGEAEQKALAAICNEYGAHRLGRSDCATVAAVRTALPAEWMVKLEKKVMELSAPLCTRVCAATLEDRAAAWEERERTGEKLDDIEKVQAERDRDWRDRVRAAALEAQESICTDYNKTGAPPILPEDCRDRTVLLPRLSAEWRAKLAAKTDELAVKVCQEFNATVPASWRWINTSGRSGCTLSALREKGSRFEAEAVRKTRFSPTLFSISAAVDRQDYKYIVIDPLDPAAPPKESLADPTEQSEFGFAITGAYGKLFFVGRSFLYGGGGVSLTRTFEGGPSKQICQPSDTEGVTLCEDIVTAAPKEKSRQTVHAEARWFPSKRVGLIPRVAYEFDQEIASVQLTTFFLAHETKGLNGGIDVGYSDNGKGLVARLFVGTSFSLLP